VYILGQTFENLFAPESAPGARSLESPQKRLQSPPNAAADQGARAAAAAAAERRAGLMIAVSDSLLAQGLEGEGEREGGKAEVWELLAVFEVRLCLASSRPLS
jgi:hypothetical protein